ncbi:orotidine 5'-phosphate decarboxylase [Tilletia horrida]|nr:orotidine 5'-phosphate decarboxylase [Tilletia horrida]
MPSTKREASSELASSTRQAKTRRPLFAPTAPGMANPAEAQPATTSPGAQRYAFRARKQGSQGQAAPAASSSSAPDGPAVTAYTSPKKEDKAFFDLSPRKANKPIKRELEAHEAHPAPPRWKETYALLLQQRRRIVAPVDTLGCEEAGTDERRGDKWREEGEAEDDEERAKRKRFTTLVSLMLSSQTKDPVTAAAVANLQRQLPGGLTVDSLIAASDDEVSSAINKVGFWRRKTGYIKSAAKILKEDFNGDIPKDVDDICSLPGVGPKMAYLLLQSAWQMNEGIGVDVHVHRISNRLGWHRKPTKEAEETRLNLQSWLPKPLHTEINRVLVGFGQVVCVPVSPRCDLCILSSAKLCPSRRKVDPKSIESRVKVEFLPEDEHGNTINPFPHKFRYNLDLDEGAGNPGSSKKEEPFATGLSAQVKLDGPEGIGMLLAAPAETSAALLDAAEGSAEVGTLSKSEAKKEVKADALEW